MKKDEHKYVVGYGRPPKASQFKRGQSGNPKGRPKGAREFRTLLNNELKETVSVSEGGRTKKLPKLIAMIKAQVAKACKGDLRAAQFLIAHADLLQGASAQINSSEQDAFDQLILEDFYRNRPKAGRK